MLYKQALGIAIRSRRQELGMTLRNVCDSSYLALGFLSDIETGKKEMSSQVLESIAYALDVPSYVLVSSAAEIMSRNEFRVPTTWGERVAK